MFSKTTEFLKRELFILDAELSKPLLDMRMKSYQLQKLQMINLNSDNPQALSDFDSAQDT